MRCSLRAFTAACLFAACQCAFAGEFTGIVTHVTDGDTVWVRAAGAADALPVRLQGIDAPEICQTHGQEARAALEALLLHRQVQVESLQRDDYDRVLGRVNVAGQDAGLWLVSHGHAWSDGFRHRAGPYAEPQASARQARLGLWRDDAAMRPREFRKRHGSCR
jgi:micrococcal nuclease